MTPEMLDLIIRNKFKIDFEDGCARYSRAYKTTLLGEIEIDVFDGDGFAPKINIVSDCKTIISHDLTFENILMCIESVDKIKTEELWQDQEKPNQKK